MKLNKAIKLSQLELKDPGSVPIEDLNEAQQLGIEAMERIKLARKETSFAGPGLLPSETKE